MAFNKAKALQEAEKSVLMGKFSQAIKQYLDISQKDPSDLNLLNTIGDLYVREKSVPEALKIFYRLADGYTLEGFTLKAIAIYKKISKLDSASVGPVLKLAELYQLQGWGREARQHYLQAVEFYRNKNQKEKALEILRKTIQLDPTNSGIRVRLATLCEQEGLDDEASQAYLEAAEILFRSGDLAGAEAQLKKALELNATNPQACLLRARLALKRSQPAEAEKFILSVPQLKEDHAAKKLLLEIYLAGDKLTEAKDLLQEVYREQPDDFAPVAAFADRCVEKGNYDAAVDVLSEAADEFIKKKSTGPLMERLRRIWEKAPANIPALELLLRVCEAMVDEFTLPEVLEALGHAYIQNEDWEKAEKAYQRLVAREPTNDHSQQMLKQVLAKLGKEPVAPRPEELAREHMALTPQAEAPPQQTAEEATAVKEALENSDLYARYGLTDKAVGELEKVLGTYPENVDVHQRILELCRKNLPLRAVDAVKTLAGIYRKRGDIDAAERYEGMSTPQGVAAEVTFPAPATEMAPQEIDLSAQPPHVEEEIAGMPISAEASIAETPPAAVAAPAPEAAAQELDLSLEWEVAASPPASVPPPVEAPVEAPTVNLEESREEIGFYIENSLWDEARRALGELEARFPGNHEVAELRQRLEAASQGAAVVPAAELASVISEAEAPPPPSPAAAEPQSPVPAFESPPAPSAPAEEPVPAWAASMVSPLDGLMEETSNLPEETVSQADDPETHYSLGVAFREMGLLDEAIGELQKVVKGAGKGSYPQNFLQACSLIAMSFMEKKMPAVAVKWYLRALEAPDLEEEASLSLQYDLGAAYEAAGDTRTALEKFTEVYSQDIDFRDVAEKIRVLQQKVS